MFDISIIVPVYNVEKYIDECLESILEQSYIGNVEVIVINDGSTDKSIDVVNLYKNKFKNIEIINQSNQGLGYSRNRGIDISKGKYIIFLDSDDFLDVDCIKVCYDLCEKYNLDRIGFNLEFQYEDGTKEKFMQDLEYINGKVLNGEYVYNYISKIGHFIESACTCMYRSSFLKNNNLYFNTEILYEDVLFTINSILNSNRVMYIDNLFYKYRVRKNSIMTSLPTIKNINSYIFILTELINMIELYYKVLKIETVKTLLERIFTILEKEIKDVYPKVKNNEKQTILIKAVDTINEFKVRIYNYYDFSKIGGNQDYIYRINNIIEFIKKLIKKIDIKISIIIPIYNVEKYLKQCINSVIKQDIEDIEIILINDGSNDKSINIIEEYIEKYNMITVINQENKGVSKSRNIGIENANGKYILFLDSDDYIKSNCLKYLYLKCEQNDLDIISFNYIMYFESQNTFKRERNNIIYANQSIYKGEDLFNFLIENNIEKGYAVMYMYKKSFLIKNELEFLEGIIYEDGLFICKALIKAYKTMYIPDDIYIYRIRENSITNKTVKTLNIHSNMVVMDELIKFFIDNENILKMSTKINIINRIISVYQSTMRLLKILEDNEVGEKLSYSLEEYKIKIRNMIIDKGYNIKYII